MAFPKHKTCLSILRSIIGSEDGNEKAFSDKIDRSVSWLKKASCGQITLTQDAAVRIGQKTGVNFRWLLNNDTSKQPIDNYGNSYTIETYKMHISLIQNEIVNDMPTPETDLFNSAWDSYSYPWQAIYFARKLERERDEAIKKYDNSIKIIRLLVKEIEHPAYGVDDVIDRMFLIENAKKLAE